MGGKCGERETSLILFTFSPPSFAGFSVLVSVDKRGLVRGLWVLKLLKTKIRIEPEHVSCT